MRHSNKFQGNPRGAKFGQILHFGCKDIIGSINHLSFSPGSRVVAMEPETIVKFWCWWWGLYLLNIRMTESSDYNYLWVANNNCVNI